MRTIVLLLATCLLAAAWAQEEAAKAEGKPAAKSAASGAKYWNTDQGKWSENPAVPGAHFMVVSGDPSKGPSLQYVKFEPNAAIGFHWHTPAEVLMGDSGTMEVQMWKSENTIKITSGSYGRMPGHMIHKAKCISNEPCTFYLEAPGVFDIHLVDDKGNEIKPKSAKAETKK